MKLTDQVNDLSKRIGALESEGFDESSSVARITKIYGNLKITMKIKAWLHEYRKCGDTNPIYPATCGTDTFL
ncbi:hypothetical protein [Paenibacillus naphthalenovorans]|uniref:hypothetical protein n=1 Tax=Paenibacillus naphthalenovorans TaxID=162209 RepID=UPI003D2CD687